MNNKIIIRHSSIVINDYNLGDCESLEKIFRMFDKTTHSYYTQGIEYIEDEKKLILPRGIDIWYLEKLFKCNAVVDYNCDPYDKIGSVMIKYLPRDDKQKETLRFMLGEGEYTSNKNRSQLCTNRTTGAGKTYCQVVTIAYKEIKSIVVTYSVGWLEQWKNCICEYTDIKPNEIYLISGAGSIYRLLNKVDTSKYKIYLVTHATLQSFAKTNGWYSIGDLFKTLKIGIKVFDESHMCFDNMCKIDYYTNTKITYYLTATSMRSNDEEDRIFQLYFKNIPGIELFDEDEDPHTDYIGMKYNSHPNPQEISNCRNQYGLDRNKYTNYITTKDAYYDILHIIIDLALKQKGKTLIYIGTNEAIRVTYEWIIMMYPELENDVGIYTSITTTNKEAQKDKRIILSTTKSCGAAMDIKGLKMTVVLAEPFKSEILARQTLGRTRDDDTLYIEVVDKGFSQIMKFYYQKKQVFSKYAKNCSEMTLSDTEMKNRVDKILAKREQDNLVLIKVITFYKEGQFINPISFTEDDGLRQAITFI